MRSLQRQRLFEVSWQAVKRLAPLRKLAWRIRFDKQNGRAVPSSFSPAPVGDSNRQEVLARQETKLWLFLWHLMQIVHALLATTFGVGLLTATVCHVKCPADGSAF